MSRPSFDATVLTHPGRPDSPLLAAVIDRMLVHPDPVIVFTKLEDGGAPIPAKRLAQAIVEAWEAYQPHSFGVLAKGQDNTLVVVTRNVASDVQGRISLYWKLDPALTDAFVDLLADGAGALTGLSPGGVGDCLQTMTSGAPS